MWSKEQLEAQYRVPFGDQAMKVLQTAEAEAKRLRHPLIGTEHLLLGYLAGEDTRLLSTFPASRDLIKDAVLFIIGGRKEDQPVEGVIGFTHRAQDVILRAAKIAKRLHDNALNPDHLLRGIIREGGGVAAPVLKQFGVGLPKMARQI